VTSFIYAVNYIYYFLFESTIVSHAIAVYFDVPINSAGGTAIFAVLGLITIALVWRGMHAMSFLQSWGFPLFVVLLVVALWKLGGSHNVVGPAGWNATGTVGWAAMWSALSFANGQMIFQGLMATDYGRFAARNIRYRGTATIMLLELIPMFTVIFLGAFIGSSLVSSVEQGNAQDPGFMFVHVMGIVGVLFVVVTQFRINVMNLYSGSIALSSGFDVAAHFRPGRPWWIFVVWFFGVLFYATNVINHLGTFLAVTGVLTNTWVLIILADYFICRRWLRLGRAQDIEFREDEVRAWNPCGLISLCVAVVIGGLGILEIYPIYYASFVAMAVGPVLHIVLTAVTKGRYYTPPSAPQPALDEAATR
jgi:cytosine permease